MRFPRKSAIAAGGIVLVAILFYFVYQSVHSHIIFGIREDFSKAVPYDKPVPGIPGIRAEQCGSCHQAIYEEWKTSYHSKAYVDPFFQAYWRKDQHIWICLNCHTPMQPQQPWLIKGLEGGKVYKPIKADNPHYDADFQQEGITCASCHVRDGVIEGPYEDIQAPHPTRYAARFRTTDICFTCHQVPSGPFQFYNGGPCSTFPEFEAGPYYKRGMICQDCHMPSIERSLVSGGPVRQGRQHFWRGGHFPEMIKRAVTVQLTSDRKKFQPGEMANFTLKLTNSGAGHKIPTGDPDRYFTITFEVVNGAGKVLKLQEDTMRRWIVWWPVIIEVYENRLAPEARRDYHFQYRLPENTEGLKLRASVKYHIMTESQYKRLQTKFGLSVEVPHVFTITEEEFRLNEPIPITASAQESQSPHCNGPKG
ncbi:MAG: hypothetical protein HY283_09070 [Nitrospirae bacterium]|nr:hypothetical protein [Nitrospirota bacterium]